MHQVTIRNKTYQVPEGWSELNSKQIIRIAPYILGTPESLPYRRAMILHKLLNVNNSLWVRLSNVNNAPKLHEMCGLIDWAFDELNMKPLITEFELNGQQYLLPSEGMHNASMIEFAFADKAFSRFVKLDNTEKNLKDKTKEIDLIVAILCRPKRIDIDLNSSEWEGDPREIFSTPLMEKRAIEFKKLDIGIKSIVFLYFIACKKYIHKQYAVLFEMPEEEQDAKLEFGKIKLNAPDFGWMGVIFQLAESGTFGDFDKVKYSFLHTACAYLSKKAYEYYAQLDKQSKNK